jgi:hypothetical protein
MNFVFLLMVSLVICGSALAQHQPTKPQNCESDISILDAASRKAGEDGLIIAIARLGQGERARSVSHRRLHNIRVYLTEWNGRRDPKTVVIAEGERTSGYGGIELYVGGRLFHTLLAHPNADLIVGSCTYEINSPSEQQRENNLYPWLDRFPRKPKQSTR